MRTLRIARASILSLLTVLWFGCIYVSEPRLVGTYEARCSCVRVTLIIKADHSFVQIVHNNSGEETARLTGTWEKDSPYHITFKPFLGFERDIRGERFDVSGARPEDYGFFILMGPETIGCPEASCKADYRKIRR